MAAHNRETQVTAEHACARWRQFFIASLSLAVLMAGLSGAVADSIKVMSFNILSLRSEGDVPGGWNDPVNPRRDRVGAVLIDQNPDLIGLQEVADGQLTDLINNWEGRTGLRLYWNDRQINTSLLISAEEAAKRRAMGRVPGLALPTPNSMRNVEPSTVFLLRENLTDRS